MDGFNQIDTLRKGKKQSKSGLFLLDTKGASGSIRSEVALENRIRLGDHSDCVGIIRRWMEGRDIVARFRNNYARVIHNRSGLPQGSVFSPFLFARVLDIIISGFKEFTIRSIRHTDFLAIHLSAFPDDLALDITDVSFKDIVTVAQQHCIGEIERWEMANFQWISPG